MAELELTKKRAKWVKNRDTVLKGSKLAYNAAQQERYVAALELLVKQMARETKKQIVRLFKGEISDDFFKSQEKLTAMDASLASQARILLNSLSRTFEEFFNLKASSLAKTMVQGATKTSASTVQESLKKLTGGLTLKTSIVSSGQEEVSTALVSENVSLIKSIPQEYLKDVTGSVMRSITTGRGIADLIPDLEKYEGISYRRAKNIALDQTRKAYNSINRQKLLNNSVKQFEWGHSGGNLHPRESHIDIAGKVFSFEHIREEQAALGVPQADRGLPGEPINCFLGDTEVSLANGCLNLWRYEHRGDIVNIILHNGEVLRSTLNHPILTLQGFQPANEIQEGQYLACTKMENLREINKNITRDKITFDNLFESLNVSLVSKTRLGSEFNFHGDIPVKNVDAIRVDNMLPFSVEIFDEQQLEKLFFSLSEVIRHFVSTSLETEIFEPRTPGIMGYCFSLLDAKTFHPKFTSRASVSKDHATFFNDISDYLTANLKSQRETHDALAVFISSDDISTLTLNVFYLPSDRVDIIESITKCLFEMPGATFIDFTKFPKTYSRIYSLNRVSQKSISVFEGHVYTMETEKGWYSVSPARVVSKNCKCYMRPIIVFETDED